MRLPNPIIVEDAEYTGRRFRSLRAYRLHSRTPIAR
jgi:hypothetical protein